jgi:hypothetical protein
VDPVALAQSGPVAILLVILGALFAAIVRGDLVPGFIYRAAVARAEKAEAIAELAVKNVEAVTAAVQKSIDDRVAAGSR